MMDLRRWMEWREKAFPQEAEGSEGGVVVEDLGDGE
jgi:hypothetical protein